MDTNKLAHLQALFGVDLAEIAHDINNRLAILQGYSKELSKMAEGKTEFKEAFFQKALPKIDSNIEKLTLLSKGIVELRKSDQNKELEFEFDVFVRKWFKVTRDIFENSQQSISMTVSESKTIRDNKTFWINLLNHIVSESNTDLEIAVSFKSNQVCIECNLEVSLYENPRVQMEYKNKKTQIYVDAKWTES